MAKQTLSSRLGEAGSRVRDLEAKLAERTRARKAENERTARARTGEEHELVLGEVLYSIVSELFIERVNFKKVMFSQHLDEMEQYGSFAPNVYFTNEFEFDVR